jgi:hypothetical protein
MQKTPLVKSISVGTDDRISIPKHFSDRLKWIQGTEVQGWLYLVEPGRFRLLSDEEVQNDPQLDPVRLTITQETFSQRNPASYAERSTDAAIAARLFPMIMKFHTGGWRIPFAEEWRALAPPDSNPRAISFLFSPEGYLEIWYTDTLRKALTPSWQNR